jgi:decaprenylphospho-beta-D-ribofuranose 2-oxidase
MSSVAMRRETVCTWGGAKRVSSWVARPRTLDGVRTVFREARAAGHTIGLRGGGQSYGDAALNADGVCLDLSGMRRILSWDPQTGLIELEPGVSIGQLWEHVVGDGWWPHVVPGAQAVTIGGAVAMNVHGKNHWRAGPFGAYVRRLDVLLPSGELLSCGPDVNPSLFRAVVGSFGMLGCVVRCTLELHRVRSGRLWVEPLVAQDLDEMLAIFEERLGTADYLVGWIDPFMRGARLGRGLVHQAREPTVAEDPDPDRSFALAAQRLPHTAFGVVPLALAWPAMRPFTVAWGVRLVNAARFRLGRHEAGHPYLQPLAWFHFLLDRVPNWKRAYGRHGLIQYQSFIPAAAAGDAFRAQLARCQAAGIVPYVGIFKRHRADEFLMSYAVDGYSLGLDFKVTAGNRAALLALARELDEIVVAAGGRFYFAKDSTVGAASVAASLGAERIGGFLALKRELDPGGLLQTDLYRRLFGDAAR